MNSLSSCDEEKPGRFDGSFLTENSNRNETADGVCFEYPNHTKIDFLLTYQCNASCAHCITSSNPYRKEWLEKEEVISFLEIARNYGKHYVSFTGGEPLLHLPFALDLIREAKARGYAVFSDTNAYWGGSEKKALSIAQELKDAGLDGLFPSADAYHLPFISLTKVRNVIDACDAVGLTCEINYCPGPDHTLNAQIVKELDLEARGFFSDGLSLNGNDVEDLKSYFPKRIPAELHDIGSMHLGVSPRGDCFANVDISYDNKEFEGTPFSLGSIRREGIEEVLTREAGDPLIRLMQETSPAIVDAHLSADPEHQEWYNSLIATREYYSSTEYWLELFHSDRKEGLKRTLRDLQVKNDTPRGMSA
ncbi:radical SAM protein [Parerythrobacter aestuarii]|uniref:radical SAM protein n=1 Tax=Parerythrobacter aestuarii TaxID=3020909 RepID=UPI0024DE6870|nr:radical SAM protein [Parerythrobacter aestuarii]